MEWLSDWAQTILVLIGIATLWIKLSITYTTRGELTTAISSFEKSLSGFQTALQTFQNEVNLTNGRIVAMEKNLKSVNDSIIKVQANIEGLYRLNDIAERQERRPVVDWKT